MKKPLSHQQFGFGFGPDGYMNMTKANVAKLNLPADAVIVIDAARKSGVKRIKIRDLGRGAQKWLRDHSAEDGYPLENYTEYESFVTWNPEPHQIIVNVYPKI